MTVSDDTPGGLPDDHPDAQAIEVLGDTTPAFTLAFLRSSPDCVILLGREGRISFMSDNGRRALEIEDMRDVTGRTWWELFDDEAADQPRAAVQTALAGRLTRFTADWATAKGRPRTWDITVSPLVDAEGRVESILAVCRQVAP